jgi:hypothetical protein
MARKFLGGSATSAGSGTASRPPVPVAGETHYRTDKNFMETYDGTAWRVDSAVVCAPADISNPLDGQVIFNSSDQFRQYRYHLASTTWYRIEGRISSVASGTTPFNLTTTEQVISSITATLVAGQRVRCGVTFVANAASTGTNGFFKLRAKQTATVDTSGTVMPGGQAAPNLSRATASDNSCNAIAGEFTVVTTGSHVFAWTGNVGTSTGVVAADTSNHGWLLYLDAIGS